MNASAAPHLAATARRFLPFIVALACVVLVAVSCYRLVRALTVTHGLRASYYANAAWQGAPFITLIDDEITTTGLADLVEPFSRSFSADWQGALVVDAPGPYIFATRSDDGSELSIDGQRIVDNGATHGMQEAQGEIALNAGMHAIQVRYFQAAGQYGLGIWWAKPGGPLEPIGSGVLLPDEMPYGEYKLRRLAPAAAAFLVLIVASAIGVVWRARLIPALPRDFDRVLAAHREFMQRTRGPVVLLIVIGIAIRLLLLLTENGIFWPDSDLYYMTAKNLLRGDWVTHDPFKTPLYGLFLSGFLAFGDTPGTGIAIVAAQQLLGVLSGIMVYKIARRLFNPIVAFYGSALFSLHTVELYYELSVLTEVLFVFLLSALLYTIVRIGDRWRPLDAVAVGTLCGLLTLARPVGQGFVACVLLVIWLRGRSWKRAVVTSALVSAVYLALVIPWMALNSRTYGFWGMGLGQGLGLFIRVFDIDHFEPVPDTKFPEVKEVFELARMRPGNVHYAVRDEMNFHRGYSAHGADEAMFEFALEPVKAHPAQFAAYSVREWYVQLAEPLTGVRTCRTAQGPYLCSGRWEGYQNGSFSNAPKPRFRTVRTAIDRLFGVVAIPMGAVVPLAGVGMIDFLWRRRRARIDGLLLAMAIGYFTFVPAMLQWPEARYRLPIDAFLLVFAVWTLYRVGEVWREAAERDTLGIAIALRSH